MYYFLTQLFVYVFFSHFINGQFQEEECCSKINVNVSDENAELNGIYSLKSQIGSVNDSFCSDGCLYTKDGFTDLGDFCFSLDAIRTTADISGEIFVTATETLTLLCQR